jgi:hypothetical protein
MLTPIVAAATLFVTPAGAVQADTVTARYRVDTRSESVADLSGLGGGEQRQSIGMSSFLTVHLADTTGGRRFRIVVDSMTVEPGTPIPPAVADSVRGLTWSGLLAEDGTVSELVMPDGDANQQFSQMINSFFPRTRQPLDPGKSWVDTLDVNHNDSTTTSNARTITEWRVAGPEERDGVAATRLDATFTLTMSATTRTPQGMMDAQGSGAGRSTYYVGPDQAYLGGTTELQSDVTLALPNSPMPVPVSSTTTTTVTQIR